MTPQSSSVLGQSIEVFSHMLVGAVCTAIIRPPPNMYCHDSRKKTPQIYKLLIYFYFKRAEYKYV